MYSPEAKFEEHRFNICRDILDWVLNWFNLNIWKTKKDIHSKKKNAIGLYFERPFK